MTELGATKAAMLRGRLDEARHRIRRSIVSDPACVECQAMLGRLDLRTGDTEGALKHLARAGELIRYAGYVRSDLALRRDIAIAVGRLARGSVPARPVPRDGRPRVLDCFLFNNELRLLDLHLEEADDFVDQFVIVEAPETFTGQSKPLCFAENKHRYAKYADKIRHVVAPIAPPVLRYPWMREFWQRHHIIAGLDRFASDDDYVIIGDCDEILNRHFLVDGLKDFAALKMRNYRYFLNYLRIVGKKRHWIVSAVARFEYVRSTSPAEIRSFTSRSIGRNPDYAIDDTGWHFSSVGDARLVQAKLAAYSHQENVAKGKSNFSKIEREIAQIRDGRFEPDWLALSPEIEAPATVARHPDRYADLLVPVDPQALSDRLEFFVQEMQLITRRRRTRPEESW